MNVKEEIQYCNHCGGANKKSAVECIECEKRIHTSYRPFYDFLKKHTKDDIKGKITDSVFSYIKNFLFSHLYGIALSVTIVATAVSAAYTAQPYIENVSEIQTATVQPAVTEKQSEPLNEDDLYDFYHLSTSYDAFADLLRASEPYWGADGSDYSSVDEMYAENNIPDFPHKGVHEMISNPIAMYMEDPYSDISDIFYDRYLDEGSAVQDDACTSDIAKALRSEGYRVAECNYVLCDMSGDYDAESHTGGSILKKLVYRFVYVEHQGKWYLVEDRLVENING